jgi:E2/UBC family protein E
MIEILEDGARYYIVFKDFKLPDGKYQMTATDLMVMTDYQYPASKMDMFWTDPAVHCLNGSFPQSADQFEQYAGRRWQRWSWHYPQWDPAQHSVITHLEVVQDRLARGS